MNQLVINISATLSMAMSAGRVADFVTAGYWLGLASHEVRQLDQRSDVMRRADQLVTSTTCLLRRMQIDRLASSHIAPAPKATQECPECGFTACTCPIDTLSQLQRAYGSAVAGGCAGLRMTRIPEGWLVKVLSRPRERPAYGSGSTIAEALTGAFKAFWEAKA